MPPHRPPRAASAAPGHGGRDSERGHGREHVLHGENVLVVDGEHQQSGEERAREEDGLAGQQRQQGRGGRRGAQEGGSGAVGAGQARAQLVRQLVEVAQLQAGQAGPAARAQRARLSPQQLHVAVEGVQHLPGQHQRAQRQVHGGQQQHRAPPARGQSAPLVAALVGVGQLPAPAEEREGAAEEEQVDVERQAAAEEGRVASPGQRAAGRQQALVGQRHLVVGVAQDAVMDVQLRERPRLHAQPPAPLQRQEARLHLGPGD